MLRLQPPETRQNSHVQVVAIVTKEVQRIDDVMPGTGEHYAFILAKLFRLNAEHSGVKTGEHIEFGRIPGTMM